VRDLIDPLQWEIAVTSKAYRLKAARESLLNLPTLYPKGIVSSFESWRDYVEFLVLHREESPGYSAKTIAVKCSKRGNDVYGRRTERKLGFLKESENEVFFQPKDFDSDKPVKTRLLWVTLTWNSNLSSLKESWEHGEYYYNLFITNLRNHYGRIDVLRFPQASPDENGAAYCYLHYHLVLLFLDCEFTVFPSLSSGGDLSYRIEEKDELAAQGKWHSFIDVKAINSMAGIYNYAVKHYENAGFGTSDEATLNNAFCWIFKKKSYTVSGGFRARYAEYITSLRNSKTCLGQSDLTGGVFPQIWVLVGIKSVFELSGMYGGLDFGDRWTVELPYCAWDPPGVR